ncbi:DUF4238 domain-containing protein [Capillimicrobium parvum]|uniref:DUF4238 domain-containing protein n=1 Tax=Capillimicrobium parvum TaxID=2884022 RepID=A0A9E6XX37_9ACTN|nr:DUF4238 domain-containing protein [Capillimicrobium parvum]UGS36107.1 hypothetical protein DSM104329_02507 [Capillimicrobium parvum]
MAARHHYLPRFLQRRFGCDPADRNTTVVRMDVSTGECRAVHPAKEASLDRYYRLTDNNAKNEDGVEGLLGRIESAAAPAITKVVGSGGEPPEPRKLVGLARFVATLAFRTPDARADLAAADIEFSKLAARQLFSDPAATRRALGPDATYEAVARWQRKLLDGLRDGNITFERDPVREIGMMLRAVEPLTQWLISAAWWELLRAPQGRQFVLSDAPVAHRDPTPPLDGAGAGFNSSPGAMTVLPIDPVVALLIRPAPDGLLNWVARDVGEALVDDLNLLIYAQAGEAVYASSRQILEEVRANARRDPQRVVELRRRRMRVWVGELGPKDAPGQGGVREFTGRNRDGTVTASMRVSAAQEADALRRAI